ncbi:MAG TPA: NADP-dependent oxidoreductase [Steroidobacteraceae bacterium]
MTLLLALQAGAAEHMRAAVIASGRIQLREVSRPGARPGQVLVRLQYAGVNPIDWKGAVGDADEPAAAPAGVLAAAIPGVDGAGTISALGHSVTGFRVGDPVLLWSKDRGTYAQYVAVPAAAVTPIPNGLSLAQAAGLPHAGLAAWNMLVDQARVRAGRTVLVIGGAGGVGSAAVQIAVALGAHVTATTSAANADYLRSLGAATVIDYTTQHFEDQLRNVDIAIDTVDLDNAYRALSVLRRGGLLVSSVGVPEAAACQARGVTCLRRTAGATPVAAILKQLTDWTLAHRFRVNVDRSFELAQVAAAWQYSQAGQVRGKVVIRIGD